MSAQHEMAVVAKCLQLGAVDYLVKPLRLNEVMNLWTHMWRRRRMVWSLLSTLGFHASFLLLPNFKLVMGLFPIIILEVGVMLRTSS